MENPQSCSSKIFSYHERKEFFQGKSRKQMFSESMPLVNHFLTRLSQDKTRVAPKTHSRNPKIVMKDHLTGSPVKGSKTKRFLPPIFQMIHLKNNFEQRNYPTEISRPSSTCLFSPTTFAAKKTKPKLYDEMRRTLNPHHF